MTALKRLFVNKRWTKVKRPDAITEEVWAKLCVAIDRMEEISLPRSSFRVRSSTFRKNPGLKDWPGDRHMSDWPNYVASVSVPISVLVELLLTKVRL